MTYNFQSTSYPTDLAMHRAIAQEWLSAGGLNDDTTQQQFLAQQTDVDMANEAITAWELYDNSSVDREMLVRAFAALRK